MDVRGAAGRQPGAAGLPRAGPAIRLAGGAHQGAELHDGHRPVGGGGVVVGQQTQCPLALGPVEAGGRKGLTADGAGQDPSDIRIQHEGAPTVGEGQDRTGRVLPHPGQGQEGVQVIWQDAAVLLDDAAGALDEPQGPAWVAQATPDPQHRSGGGLGELGGTGPAPHPLLPGRDDAGHRGLLAHDL